MASVLEVRRGDLGVARVVDVRPSHLEDGQTRFSVERFGLTANNVTYALLGDRLRYWSFFPSAEEGWGRVPAWGFSTAVESRCADVRPGTRIFGYLPMGGELVLTPQPAGDRGLDDRSPHRAELPAVYNRYRRGEASARDDAMMVLQPLFMTSVLLARSLEGASRVILSSASSKTALGTAYLLAHRGAEVIGITASVGFVRSLELYANVVRYDAVEELERRPPAIFVDFAGDSEVRAAVHRHLGGELRASVLVGGTHMDAAVTAAEPLPGPEPTFFFAPDHVRGGIDRQARAAFDELVEWSAGWLELERRDGAEAILATWADAIGGRLSPRIALSLAL